ncbi:MAG TPA: 50S ribosomal protein L9 [Myxococcota bacterium]|nr:50S ribosomal protein L9 [Myxococcota bacterium]
MSARAGEGGRLFGSVTSAQIATVLVERGFEIDRRRIDLREGIKLVGEHAVPVKLHRDVIAKIKVQVVAVEGAPEEAEEEEVEERSADEDRRARRRERREESDED